MMCSDYFVVYGGCFGDFYVHHFGNNHSLLVGYYHDGLNDSIVVPTNKIYM